MGSMISDSLARSPLVRFTPDELASVGDGIPRTAGGKPLPWVWDFLTDTQRAQLEEEQKAHKWE